MTDPALTWQITLGNLVGGDTLGGSLTRVSGQNVGTYAINQGSLNNETHTLVGTGVDNRKPDGSGTLVLVSPTTVNLGPLGSLAASATLTVPEPGAAMLGAAAIAGLLAVASRKRSA